MVEKNLTPESGVPKSVIAVDDSINSSGIAVDNVSYDAGTFLDRDYDIRSLKAFSMMVHNIDGANGLTYTIQTATKTFANPDDLADADFTSDGSHTDVPLAAGAKSVIYKLNRDTDPSITAVRLRAKETVGAATSLLRADIRGTQR